MHPSNLFMHSVLTCYRKTHMQSDWCNLIPYSWKFEKKKWLVENHCLKMFPGKGGRERTNSGLWNEHSGVCKKKREHMYSLFDIFWKNIAHISFPLLCHFWLHTTRYWHIPCFQELCFMGGWRFQRAHELFSQHLLPPHPSKNAQISKHL